MAENRISVAVGAAVGLAAIIGAGIFVLSGTAIALAGVYSLVAFAIVGVLALIIALELGELGSLMPHVKGASYSYTYAALGSELGFITGILRYVALATAIGAIALGFGSYFTSFFGISSDYSIPVAIAIIGALSGVNVLGVKKAAEADLWLVVIKICILLLFAGFAIYLAFSHAHVFANVSFALPGGGLISGIFAASIVVFFAYSGFQSISSLTDRISDGSRGYVRSILLAVGISIIVYTLVVFAMLLLMPTAAYKISADPLANALKYVGAPEWLLGVVDIGAMVATASATIAMILTASRALYQMSIDGLLPRYFRRYDKRRDAAVNGILASAVIGIAVLFAGNIYVIASIANFGLMFNYMMVGFDVIHFRKRGKRSPFLMPLYPYLPILSILMILVFFTGMPKEALVFGIAMVLMLIVAYYALIEDKNRKIERIRIFK